VGELKRRLIDVWGQSVILRFDRGPVFVWTPVVNERVTLDVKTNLGHSYVDILCKIL
jgi:hypothetical protein